MKTNLLVASLALALAAGCSQGPASVWGSPRVDPALLAQLQDLQSSEAHVRLAAATQLGEDRCCEPAGIDGLADVLRDPDREVRQAAAGSLVRIGTPPALRSLRLAALEGWVESRTAYVNAIHTLRQQASTGDGQAGELLDALSEGLASS